MSSSKIDQSDDEFGANIGVRRKSAFMELTFEERVFKMRNYLTDTTWPWPWPWPSDGQTLKKKIQFETKGAQW